MKSVDLAIQAGRKRQSSRTGFVHHCYEGMDVHDTIPMVENFCFALALFRTRLSENVLEGKALLDKLLAFQVGDNFPVYLHEYPRCRDRKTGMRIYAALFWIYRDFQMVLGEELKQKLRCLLEILPKPEVPDVLDTPEAWAEFLIDAQIEGRNPTPAFAFWDADAFVYTGPQKQEKREPALTLYDLYMSQATTLFSRRALSDHPVHLRASLIHPFILRGDEIFHFERVKASGFDDHRRVNISNMDPSMIVEPRELSRSSEMKDFIAPQYTTPYKAAASKSLFFWGDISHTHSLCFEAKGSVDQEIIVLPEEYEPDAMEVAWYCDAHPDTRILVEGARATTFQMGESVQILTETRGFNVNFNLLEGEGVFFGHIFRANRSSQISCKGENRYETYDWKIALRTVRRSPNCVLKISLSVC